MAENNVASGEGTKPICSHEDTTKRVSELEGKVRECIQRTVTLEKDLKIRTEEREVFKSINIKLEEDIAELKKKQIQNLTESQEFDMMKQRSEEVLTKAKSMIFEKTKVCQNQELQIQALSQQVVSLKEVVSITKDLLEIRNMEVKHLQDQINLMGEKIQVEKERQDLVHTKLEKMITLNSDLKGEYQTQLCLFNALRQRYNEKELSSGIVKETNNGEITTTTTTTSSGETTAEETSNVTTTEESSSDKN